MIFYPTHVLYSSLWLFLLNFRTIIKLKIKLICTILVKYLNQSLNICWILSAQLFSENLQFMLKDCF